MFHVKVTKLGDSLALLLPPEVLSTLKVGEGDTICLQRASVGYRLFPQDPELEEQLRVAREVMDEHRDVLRALSKT